MTTVVIDHGRANLFSLTHALGHLGARYVVSADAATIASASRIVLPGVGAFGDVMKGVLERGLAGPLHDAVARSVPLLGICVGMQVLADRSEEFGDHAGLGLVPGQVRRLADPVAGSRGLRVPNVGWRELRPNRASAVLRELQRGTMVYFVHSYAFDAERSADVAATIDFNGQSIAAAICRGPIIGYQFHPEKSGRDGLELIRFFLDRVPALA